MKRKILALLLAAVMALSLVACGGGNSNVSSTSSTSTASSAVSTVADAGSADSTANSDSEAEANVQEENADSDSADIDVSDWSCYWGVMDDESTVYYAYSPEGDRAAFISLSADETMSISIIGDYVYDENTGIGSITDDATGLTFSDITTDNGDGTYTVDYGSLGTAVITDADPQEVLAAMDTIQAGTTDMTAAFIASLE